ncbi:MAG: AAA family ATPase [Sulfuricella sp.]
MYLKKLTLENVGPLAQLNIEPSFENERPKPLVFVGANGSGKSIALSFIANFMLHLQQQLFENTEVEKGKVFKLRSPIYIGPAAKYYYGSVTCSDEIGLEEWQLSVPKKDLVSNGVAPNRPSWNNIGEEQTNALFPIGEAANTGSDKLKMLYSQHCALYFPPNRFEEPAWLNADSLSYTPTVSATQNFHGVTRRQIISSNVFPNLISWLYDIIIDSYVFETAPIEVTIGTTGEVKDCLLPLNGSNRTLRGEIDKVLEMIFAGRYQGKLNLNISPKNARNVGLSEKLENGLMRTVVQNLFSLSSGESLVLSLFASIIRDFDLGGTQFTSLEDIKGIVLVDEIDIHLHIDLQRKVLPRLIKAFPKVQFIVTTHSPLFLLGMDEQFGSEGYEIYSLPTGEKIQAEEFSEFHRAYDEYKNTHHHKSATQQMLAELVEPCLITEGKTDRMILECAWEKLYGTTPCFCSIKSSGEVRCVDGSAKHVQSILQYTAALATYPIIGLFDNDGEGNGQFGGLQAPSFVSESKDHKKNGLVSALLLPVPELRDKFVNQHNGNHCFLEIEHYFSDAVLSAQNKKGAEIIAGTGVFEIQGDKNGFAESVVDLDAEEFDSFHQLFCRLADILSVPPPKKIDQHRCIN